MARIRTIKPEFPQSESMGRVGREARLCFILLWTLADDSGRLRGNSRMLASLLYPYDDDAPKLIDGWLNELQAEGCVQRYAIAGDSYLAVSAWGKHQKIDKPSASKLPGPETQCTDTSRILANAREQSLEDQGRDQGRDQDHSSPDGAGGEISTGLPNCPHSKLIASFIEKVPELPRPKPELWDGKDADAMRQRWKWVLTATRESGERYATNEFEALDWFGRYFDRVAASDFLTGRDAAWSNCNLGWLMKRENFAKVVQGNYTNRVAA